MIYNENDTRCKGVIDVTDNTIVPVLYNVDGTKTNLWFEFDRSGIVGIQMWSDDLSASVSWALQISMDGTNWAAATDANGDAIAGVLVADTPFIDLFEGSNKLKLRVSFTVTTQTGTINYIFRNHVDYA